MGAHGEEGPGLSALVTICNVITGVEDHLFLKRDNSLVERRILFQVGKIFAVGDVEG